ncbi:hypothetical protein, partial [Peribacillus frigoritolerans]|uniref:hypothetical protein n=1 Tax=Peribacillus frigoritolerans TaxID=450367 RepID=UPI00215B1DE7
MFFTVILIGWKKFATLLPNYWLAEIPQTLTLLRLGRQSAERERISEINWNLFKEKTELQANAFPSYMSINKTRVTFMFFLLSSLLDGRNLRHSC